jgi:hypothetical protein
MIVLPLKQYSNFQNTTTQNCGAVKIELTQANHAPCGQPTEMYHEHKALHLLHAVDADSRTAAQKITYPIGSLISSLRSRHWTVSWASLIQSTISSPV